MSACQVGPATVTFSEPCHPTGSDQPDQGRIPQGNTAPHRSLRHGQLEWPHRKRHRQAPPHHRYEQYIPQCWDFSSLWPPNPYSLLHSLPSRLVGNLATLQSTKIYPHILFNPDRTSKKAGMVSSARWACEGVCSCTKTGLEHNHVLGRSNTCIACTHYTT